MSTKRDKRFSVKKSSSGLGLFTNVNFQKDDIVIEYTGETISTQEADRRGGKYLAELNNKWTIDGKTRSNIARYINHSCKPNCYYELNEEETRIFAVAKKHITAGEELTVHYGKEYWKEHIEPHGCKCQVCQAE